MFKIKSEIQNIPLFTLFESSPVCANIPKTPRKFFCMCTCVEMGTYVYVFTHVWVHMCAQVCRKLKLEHFQ